MKRGTPEHPKIQLLADRLSEAGLGMPKTLAVGILESLWHWASKYAIQGDIGKWPDAVIETALGWTGEKGKLIELLIETGWVDSVPEPHRLVIHDVAEHADNTWRTALSRAGLTWWDGCDPRHPSRGRPAQKLNRNSTETQQELNGNSTGTQRRLNKDSTEQCRTTRGVPAKSNETLAVNPNIQQKFNGNSTETLLPEPEPKPEPTHTDCIVTVTPSGGTRQSSEVCVSEDHLEKFERIYERHAKKDGRILAEQAWAERLSEFPDSQHSEAAARIDKRHEAWVEHVSAEGIEPRYWPALHRWLREKRDLDKIPEPEDPFGRLYDESKE